MLRRLRYQLFLLATALISLAVTWGCAFTGGFRWAVAGTIAGPLVFGALVYSVERYRGRWK